MALFSNFVRGLSSFQKHLKSQIHTSAGIIIIGDEILKGIVQDTNSYHLIRVLDRMGLKVGKVSVIPDDVDLISTEVALFSKEFQYVVTSGGIGPTHDDMTLQGIAKAFDENLFYHPEIVSLCKKHFGEHLPSSDPVFKLAYVPQSTTLNFSEGISKFPLLQCHNVFIMPGIPKLLKITTDIFESKVGSQKHIERREMFLKPSEFEITSVLNKAVQLFSKQVTFGSYPVLDNENYRVKIVMEGGAKELEEATKYFEDSLPKDSFANLSTKT